jgi:hypothetical protein
MESLWGKRTLFLDTAALAERRRSYIHCLIDLGTGDGRFVQHMAESRPDCFFVGIDACREQLRAASRKAPDNALYVIANAQALPWELNGLATHITINFPWGSLRDSLVMGDAAVMNGLAALAQPGARMDVRLNESALNAGGWSLEEGVAQSRQRLLDAGFAIQTPVALSAYVLRQLPTTWAKRLAYGRDPRAMALSGVWEGSGGIAAPRTEYTISRNSDRLLDRPAEEYPEVLFEMHWP